MHDLDRARAQHDDDLRVFPPPFQRVAAASGLLFVAFLVASAILTPGDLPDFDDPPREYAAFAAEHRDRFEVIALLVGLAVFEFLWFLGYMRSVVGRAEAAVRGHQRLTDIAFAGGVTAAALFAVGAALQVTASSEPAGTDPSVVRALVHAGSVVSTFASAGLATMLLSAGNVISRIAPVPRWLGFLGLVAGALYLVTLFSVLTLGDDDAGAALVFLPAFALAIVWVAGMSIAFLRGIGRFEPSR
jgi:hypothetical protein